MVKIRRSKMTIREQRELEYLRAEVARLKATSDYVAMMCDIEIPKADEEARYAEKN